MSYSLDLRQKVITYLENGGYITKVAKIFGIGRTTIYRWLKHYNREPTKVERGQKKLDRKALEKYVHETPDPNLIGRKKNWNSTRLKSGMH